MRIVGGAGYLSDLPVERYCRYAPLLFIEEADEIQGPRDRPSPARSMSGGVSARHRQ